MIDDVVLDASALLAALLNEPGEKMVQSAITGGGVVAMSAVNLSEVMGKLHGLGAPGVEASNRIYHFGIDIVEFHHGHAMHAASLEAELRGRGLSLADRACLALARTRDWPVLTAQRAWAALDLGMEIRLIR